METIIYTADQQRDVIKEITSLTDYEKFLDTHFADTSTSLFRRTLVNDQRHIQDVAFFEDYWRLSGLVSMLCAQFGFPSLDGHILNHRNQVGVGSPFEPRFLLSFATYMGNLNDQAYPLKEELTARALGITTENSLSIAVWGLMLSIKGGIVRIPHYPNNGFLQELNYRAFSERPICLATTELNKALARLNFTPQMAMEMSYQQFMQKVFPEAKDILSPYMDIEKIFTDYRGLSTAN